MTESVSYSVDNAVASIVLTRPDASNALDRLMKEQLLEALSEVRACAAVRAVALTAAGRNFCVGQDLAEHAEALRSDPGHAMDTVAQHYNPIMLALDAVKVPVVAGIGGACVGAGLGIALGADIRIAGQRSKFGTAFCGIGLASDSGLSATLTSLIGKSRTIGLFLLGDTIDADTAQAWGLTHRVVPDGDIATETRSLAEQFATGPTAAFKAVKQLITDNAGATLGDVLSREACAQALLGRSTDHSAAIEAFLTKRRATFVGQ
jgi:2-(1,2-epoxy-1,2-dihydrophenyl)acetyl-CoA isomerase